MSIIDSFDYPLRGDPLKQIGAVGGSMLLSFLFIPILYWVGYFFEIIKQSVNGNDTPPKVSTETIGGYIKNGVVTLGILFVYLLPSVVGVVLVGLVGVSDIGGLTTAENAEAGITTFEVVVIIGATFGLGYALIALFVIAPAALGVYALSGSIKSAFSPIAVFRVIFTVPYLVALFTATLINAIGGVVTILVGFVPILGTILSSFISAPFGILVYRIYGVGVASSQP